MMNENAISLRRWQQDALSMWDENGHKGIVSVVTGGGKTVFALAAIRRFKPRAVLIVVPTLALLDQWWEEASSFLDMALEDFHIITGSRKLHPDTVNIAVINTACELPPRGMTDCMLIVDECHKAASPMFSGVLRLPKCASIGLSATPERQYDDGLNEILIPALGPVIYEYTYRDALVDRVIVPFEVVNIVFDLDGDTAKQYASLSRAIARSIQTNGLESDRTVALMIRRSRVLNSSIERVRHTLKIVAAHRGERILIFHEDIQACDLIYEILRDNAVSVGVYHSGMPLRVRANMLSSFRRGEVDVLVTCRALDEGFNVPETTIGIIAASTASRRQRIQRLGRILRPAKGKTHATVYTLVATNPEISRLREEESALEDVVEIAWRRV